MKNAMHQVFAIKLNKNYKLPIQNVQPIQQASSETEKRFFWPYACH